MQRKKRAAHVGDRISTRLEDTGFHSRHRHGQDGSLTVAEMTVRFVRDFRAQFAIAEF
jgi:hypothetical protein